MLTELRVMLGRAASGLDVVLDLVALAHWLVCGETRSGKSVACYGLLSQLAAAGPAVRVVGVDPTSVLLRPFAERLAPRRDPLIVRGTEEPEQVIAVMQALRAEMVRRLALLEALDTDKLTNFTPSLPLIVVVLEELPGITRLLAAADQAAGAKPAERLAPQFQNHLETLAAEAAKVGIRLVCLAQRPDSNILGGYAREQLTTRIGFRFSGLEGVKMLFPELDSDDAKRVSKFDAGMAFIRQPGSDGVQAMWQVPDNRSSQF